MFNSLPAVFHSAVAWGKLVLTFKPGCLTLLPLLPLLPLLSPLPLFRLTLYGSHAKPAGLSNLPGRNAITAAFTSKPCDGIHTARSESLLFATVI